MFNVMANDPLPYRPIRIVDISPIRSSIRRAPKKAAGRPPRWVRVTTATLLGAAFAVIATVATASAVPAGVAGEFRLGPGHAMPAAIAVDDDVTGPGTDPAPSAVEFRLAPGHAMPARLAH